MAQMLVSYARSKTLAQKDMHMDIEYIDSSTEEENSDTEFSEAVAADVCQETPRGSGVDHMDYENSQAVSFTGVQDVVTCYTLDVREEIDWARSDRTKDIFVQALGILVDMHHVKRPRTFFALSSCCRWVYERRHMMLSSWKILRTQMFSSTFLYTPFSTDTFPVFHFITKLDMVLTSDAMGLLVCEVVARCGDTLSDVHVRCCNNSCPFHNIMPGSYSTHRYTHTAVTDRRVMNAIKKNCSVLKSLNVNLHLFPLEACLKIAKLTTLTSLVIKGNYMCYPVSGSYGNLGCFEGMLSHLTKLEKLTLGAGIWHPGVFWELWTPYIKEIHLGNSVYHGENDSGKMRYTETFLADARAAENAAAASAASQRDVSATFPTPPNKKARLNGPDAIVPTARKWDFINNTKLYKTHTAKDAELPTYRDLCNRFSEHSVSRNPVKWLQGWEVVPSRFISPTGSPPPVLLQYPNTRDSDAPSVSVSYDPEKDRKRDVMMDRFTPTPHTRHLMANVVSISFCVVDLANATTFFLDIMPNVKKVCVYVASNDLGANGADIILPDSPLQRVPQVEELKLVFCGLLTRYSDQIKRIRALCIMFKKSLAKLSLSGLNSIDRFDFSGIFQDCKLVTSLSIEDCHFDYMTQNQGGSNERAYPSHELPSRLKSIRHLRLGVFNNTDFYLKDFIAFVHRFPNIIDITLSDNFVLLTSDLSATFSTEVTEEDDTRSWATLDKVYVRPGMVDDEKSAFLQYCRAYFLKFQTSFRRKVGISFDTFHGASSIFIS